MDTTGGARAPFEFIGKKVIYKTVLVVDVATFLTGRPDDGFTLFTALQAYRATVRNNAWFLAIFVVIVLHLFLLCQN